MQEILQHLLNALRPNINRYSIRMADECKQEAFKTASQPQRSAGSDVATNQPVRDAGSDVTTKPREGELYPCLHYSKHLGTL